MDCDLCRKTLKPDFASHVSKTDTTQTTLASCHKDLNIKKRTV